MDMDWENYSRMRKSNGERQRTNSYRTQSYIDGNTVYKTDALPKRREREETQRQVQRTPQRKPVRMAGISAKGFAFLSVMTAVVLFFAFQYLSTQYQVNHTKEEVVALQTEIADEKEDYESDYQAITDSVDLAEIYEKATKKLKMVQAESNQIYKYKNRKSDMVKQYADIPSK